MKSESERCAEYEQFKRIDAAFRGGDITALRAAVDDPDTIPNGPMPLTIGSCLEYAIYHSPLGFIRTLLDLGADPNPKHHDGFPPLIAAITCGRPTPGAVARSDVPAMVGLLLSFGANPNQRGINDYTPLHLAAERGDLALVRILLSAGANPRLRTRIDEGETAGDLAEKGRFAEIVRLLAEWEARQVG